MAARATWKGFLKISLVTIPIKVFPATDTSAVLDFHQLHRECQTRITQRRWCLTCAREVPYAEIVKGHEFEAGKYVVLSETEFDAVKPESAKVINLVQFAEASKLDPLYIDRSYYLGPDGERAGEPFAVISTALRGQVGIGRVAIYGREYLVAVRPAFDVAGAVLVLHTLHHDTEIRSASDLIGDVPTHVAPAQIKLAKQLLASFTKPRDQGLPLANFTDTYQADLKKLIEKKIKGEEIVEAPVPVEPSNLVSLRDALTRSLHLVSGGKKPAVKAADRQERKRKRA